MSDPGVVSGWVVRTALQDEFSAGLNHLRPIDEARGCIDAAVAHPLLRGKANYVARSYDDYVAP